jgi:hypothetical protein
VSNDQETLRRRKQETFDPVMFLKQRRAHNTYKAGGWLTRPAHDGLPYAGFVDPVGGGTVSIFGSNWGTQAQVERVAELFYQIAVTHWLTVSEIDRMAVIAIHGAQALDDDFDCMEEIEECIAQAKRDAQRLRKRPSLQELVSIMRRNREGLLQLMKVDPAHRDEIRTALDASAERIRRMVREHNRAVRQQRALARMKES